jgi:hypothetical protein
MNLGHARARLVEAGAVFAAVALVAGCGSQYRPVVTPINPSGPAAQPSSFAVVVSAPSATAGIATIIDYSGDSVMAQAPIGPGPTTFTLDETGTTGYTVNSDGTLSNFPVSTSLQAKNVTYSTLATTSQPVGLFSPNAGLWVADLNGNVADVMTGVPEAFKLAIPVAPTPVAIVGPGQSALRNYVISQNNSTTPVASIIPYGVACNTSPSTVTQNGEADALETSSYTVSAQIPLGKCPVYAVPSSDQRRFFVLNRGGDATNPGGSITVINSQNNTPDSCTPYLSQSGHWVTCHPSIALPAGPVYAEYNAATQQLVVANYDSSTISVVDVTLDEYGNDYNTYANNNCTTYAACGAITGGFGTVHTVSVGKNPASVTVLNDGSRAYTANQTDSTVTIVNLSSYSVEKTLGVVGHPRTVVSTQNSSYGKVYVASPDSPFLTIIRTDQDIVDTTILVEGNIVDVRVSTQNGVSTNTNNISRNPGAGQPCYLPPSLEPAPTGTQTALQVCQTLP